MIGFTGEIRRMERKIKQLEDKIRLMEEAMTYKGEVIRSQNNESIIEIKGLVSSTTVRMDGEHEIGTELEFKLRRTETGFAAYTN